MNSYELSRAWIDWAFENPEKVKPIHYAIFFFAIEHCNRLGWKKNFGLPSQMVMEAIGVKNWRTYSNGLNDLVEFGFIQMIEVSKNQYSSNIIAIVKNTKASTKALDKALLNHLQKQSTKQGQSTVSIDKQLNNKQLNNKTIKPLLLSDIKNADEVNGNEFDFIAYSFWGLFKENLKSTGITKTTTLDKAKLSNWTNDVRLMIEVDKRTKEELSTLFIFLKRDEFWKKNIQSISKLREKFEQLFIASKQPTKQNKAEDMDAKILANIQRKLRES